jgi:3-deoxy-manno-octulosonate cytidylyltransferase (CMP-KDO synthetase)
MKVAIVIPARYASSRLPGKPLLRQTGKFLVQHVYEQARLAKCAHTVLVATDDARIADAVWSFGGRVAMTRADHPSGTDRVAEAVQSLDADVVVNLQGDEPLIEPASLDLLAGLLSYPGAEMATLAVPVRSAEQWRNPNCVKVVCDARGRALYFSRSPIPFVRDGEPDLQSDPPLVLQHLGVYAYRRAFLFRLAALPPAPLEQAEKLEQLRVLAAGHPIRVGVVAHAGLGVDTPEDYERFVRTYQQLRQHKAA